MPEGNSQTRNMMSTAMSIRVVRSEFCPDAEEEAGARWYFACWDPEVRLLTAPELAVIEDDGF